MREIEANGNRADSPILLVPYVWIGDFVRCHTVVRVLKERWPNRPVDVLTDRTCAPLVDYMPGVRKAIVWDLPRRQLALGNAVRARRGTAQGKLRQRAGHVAQMEGRARAGAGRHPRANRFRRRSALRPPERRALRREGIAAHGRPVRGAGPARRRNASERMAAAAARGRRKRRRGLAAREQSRRCEPAVALAPGAVGPSKRWSYFADAATKAHRAAASTCGSSAVRAKSRSRPRLAQAGGPRVRDLTGTDLRNAILALAAVAARDLQRLGPAACGRRHRHAGDRHLRSDQPRSLEAAEPDRRGDPEQDRCALPSLPQAGLPDAASRLHARHRDETK